MNKYFETVAKNQPSSIWKRSKTWLNSAILTLDYDPLMDAENKAESAQTEILKLQARIADLESRRVAL